MIKSFIKAMVIARTCQRWRDTAYAKLTLVRGSLKQRRFDTTFDETRPAAMYAKPPSCRDFIV